MPVTTTALTTAERRALRQIQTAGGRFAVIAADHGQPLVDMLDALGVSSAPEEQRAFKADLVDTVGREASAVLLDPDVSLPAIVDEDVLARDVGLLVRIEADGNEVGDGLRRSGLIDGLGAEGARALGATAAKVMVFLRADREDLDGYTAGMVRAALEDCARADLLCVMELMTYRLDDESPEDFAARKEDLVVEGAVFLQECGSKVLKLEYPGSRGGVPAGNRRDRRPVGRAVRRRRPRGVLRPVSRVDGRRRRRLHRRALAVEGGRRPAGRRAPGVPRRRRSPPPGGAPRHRRRRRLAVRQLLVGIDVGTTYCKALVLDAEGGELGVARERTPWSGRPELDPHALARTAHAVAARALRESPAGAVAAVGVAGMAETGVLLDRRGEPVGPAIAWHDARGTEEARLIATEIGRDRFAAETGLPASRAVLAEQAALAARPRRRRGGRGALARHAGMGRTLARRRGRRRAVAGVAYRDALPARPGWWSEALAWLGVPDDFLAEPVAAGTPIGAWATRCPRPAVRSSPWPGTIT